MVKVTGCMRRQRHLWVPGPEDLVPVLPAGGGVISDIDGVILALPQPIDTRSPAFMRAAAGCGFPLYNHRWEPGRYGHRDEPLPPAP
jgi:hypothetical protein